MNTLFLLVKLQGEKDKRTRYVELVDPTSPETITMLCRYWTQSGQCLLTTQKIGTLAMIRGKLAIDDEIGLYIIVEELFNLSKWENI